MGTVTDRQSIRRTDDDLGLRWVSDVGQSWGLSPAFVGADADSRQCQNGTELWTPSWCVRSGRIGGVGGGGDPHIWSLKRSG